MLPLRPVDPAEPKPTPVAVPLPVAALAAPPEPDVEFHISDYLEKLRRRWKVIAALVTLALGLAGVHYLLTEKVYQARSRIQIERRNLSPLTNGQSPWLENFWNLEFYPTQYKLLESRGLAERVVVNLGLSQSSELDPGSSTLTTGRGGSAADQRVLGQMAQGLLGGLQVVPVRNTQLVDIIYTHTDPNFAANAANGFADAFIDYGISTRSDAAGRASSFISNQIESIKQEIQQKEEEANTLSRQGDVVPLDRETDVNRQRIETLNRDYAEATSERIVKEAGYQELMGSPKDQIADRWSGGLVGDLKRELLRLEQDYNNKLQTYRPEWPAMVELKAQIDAARSSLNRAVADNFDRALKAASAELQTARVREGKLAAQVQALSSQRLDQTSASVQYISAQDEIDQKRKLLQSLLDRQSESDMAARLQGTRESNVRIIDRALVPAVAVSPSLRKDLSRGLLFGLLLGIALAFLLDYMDRTVKTAEEVERRLGLPNLAVIPDVSSAGRTYGKNTYGYGEGAKAAAATGTGTGNEKIELMPHDRPRLAVSEAYRSLRTSLLLSSAQELRLVAVTSATAGEGKTATSVNLSIVMAQLGRRVLLIDGDLRKPRLHEVFGVSNRNGLVNILAGGEDPDLSLTVSAVPNLSLMPSGPIPPNPSELLASDRMRELLRRARHRFDFVIVDTPPVLAVTDATLIGSMVDGVVLCLRAGKVLREEARACRDRLRLSEVKVLGTVLNRHRDSAGSGYRSYQRYETYGQDPGQGSAA